MPAAARLGDLCTGHGCWPARPNIEASPDVFIDGIAAHRQGDGWATHVCPPSPPHGGTTSSGSPTVFVNGSPKARVGDPVSCGSSIADGSPTVVVDSGMGRTMALRAKLLHQLPMGHRP
ncbi:MAG: PaaR repeat-containing protein [Gammaproteobacteria bacterium]|jgi:uncharacterized Zn-binding protein involved in type VI secretion|nr:PaaR repeat-containing protein [Candidatus Neomarinimicrobiota bacterium]MBT4330368.1 PaaR repeat-containing protein [Gammaproteobacteria bacterium]MBT5370576.1 PaaR repeat-containing protein [Gammaproteobacteria bacterium]